MPENTKNLKSGLKTDTWKEWPQKRWSNSDTSWVPKHIMMGPKLQIVLQGI